MTNKNDRLELLRRRAAKRHHVSALVIVAPEPEDEPEVPFPPMEEDEVIDLDAVRSRSEEWSAGLAVYGD